MSLFESLFNESSQQSSTHILEKYFEKTHRTFRSAIENRRLGAIKKITPSQTTILKWVTKDEMRIFYRILNG